MLEGGTPRHTRQTGSSTRNAPRRWRQTVAALATITAVFAMSVGAAYANAANPLPDSHGTGIKLGTVVNNPDGSVRVVTGTVEVQVGGAWDWGELSGSSTQSSCSNR